IKKAYTVLGKPNQVELFSYDDGHGISKPKREAALHWFNRWLKHDTASIRETGIKTLPPAALTVTAAGQVQSLPGERTVMDRNMALAGQLASSRLTFSGKTAPEARRFIGQLAGVNLQDYTVVVEDKGQVEQNGLVFHKKI